MRLRCLAALVVGILLGSAARADIVPIFVTGTLDTIADDDAGMFAAAGVQRGSAIAATFYVDTRVADTEAHPLIGRFWDSVTRFEVSAGDWSIEANADLFAYSRVSTNDWPEGPASPEQPWGDIWGLSVALRSPIIPDAGPRVASINLYFAYDALGGMLDDDAILPSGDLLIAEPWRYISFQQQPSIAPSDYKPQYRIDVDSVTVPEPSVAALGVISLLPFFFRATRRVLHSPGAT